VFAAKKCKKQYKSKMSSSELNSKRKALLQQNKFDFPKRNPWFNWSKFCIVNKFQNELIDNKPIIPKCLFKGHKLTLDTVFEAFNKSPCGIVMKKNYGCVSKQVWIFKDLTSTDLFHGKNIHEVIVETNGSTVLIEEFLKGKTSYETVPFDYKVFFSNGQPRVCTVLDRNVKPVRIACFDINNKMFLNHTQDICVSYKGWSSFDDSIKVEDIFLAVEKAKKIFVQYFQENSTCSLDMFVLSDNVLLGEVTPSPGFISCNTISDKFTKLLFPYVF
jgi:hypothetical protein